MRFSEEVNSRLREYIITQMLNFLRFLLAVNDIKDSGTKTFDEVCLEERKYFITEMKIERVRAFYDLDNLYIPNYNCLWDLIFNNIGRRIKESYTPILSAYCRNHKIMTKRDLYIKMSAELDSWINTIKRFEDIVVISIGMARNFDIWHTFDVYSRNFYNGDACTNWYRYALQILIENNFENINPDPKSESYEILTIETIKNKYDDPVQQVFYKYIMIRLIRGKKDLTVKMSTNDICNLLSRIIMYRFNINIPIHSKDENIQFNNIDQIIEYAESKIPQYPTEIKDYLSILASANMYGCQIALANLAKMVELSKYNLRNLPIIPIIYGYYGATPLIDIPLEQIPEYYVRLTHNYNNTKAAKRDLAF